MASMRMLRVRRGGDVTPPANPAGAHTKNATEKVPATYVACGNKTACTGPGLEDSEPETRPVVHVNGEVPGDPEHHRHAHHAQKPVQLGHKSSQNSPSSSPSSSSSPLSWSGMASPAGRTAEFANLDEGINRQDDASEMMQVERRGNGTSNSVPLPDYSNFMLPDLPEMTLEENDTLPIDAAQFPLTTADLRISDSSSFSGTDTTLQQPEFDVITKITDQQGVYVHNVMQNEGHLDLMNTASSPDRSNLALADLPESLMEDDGMAPVHAAVQGANPEPDAAQRVTCWGTNNTICQLAEADLFASFLNSPDLASYILPLKAKDIHAEGISTFHQTLQSLPLVVPDMEHETRALSAFPLFGDEIPKRPTSGVPSADYSSPRMALVRELFDYAASASHISSAERRRHWESASIKVCTLFGLAQPHESEQCVLFQMVNLYKQNLFPLWPMICESSLENPSGLHPVLFLVAVSVGAMYLEDDNANAFGTMMQRCLQTSLITSFMDNEMAESDTIWLAQARNTIQVVSLYFGQGRELIYAQRLGSVLVSQSRHMGLFKRTGLEDRCVGSTPEEQFAAWVRAETRRRVAFGIYRADVFLSLLMNCPPSISADELEIAVPYPDSLWLSIGKVSVEETMAAVERERTKRNETRFCDLIRILRDRDEALLSMEARDYELLLFGLQEQVWKFSHDPDIFHRLTGHGWQEETDAESLDAEINRVLNSSAMNSRDHLEFRHREMKDLVLERRRLSLALEKWLQSFNASRFRPAFNKDRGRILSSLLLFHIYHLHLNVSLDALHHIADSLCNNMAIDDKRLRMAIGWAHNAQARNATYHASKIWSLLDNEAKMNPMKKPRYTLLSYMGLHHASVVLWTCFGARRAPAETPCSSMATRNDSWDGGVHQNRFGEVLTSIAFLYSRLKSMSWDAFAERVRRLSCSPFPRDNSR